MMFDEFWPCIHREPKRLLRLRTYTTANAADLTRHHIIHIPNGFTLAAQILQEARKDITGTHEISEQLSPVKSCELR